MFYIIDILDTEDVCQRPTVFFFLPIVLLWSHFNDEISGRRLFWAQDFLNLLEALAASLSCPLWPPPPPGAQRPPDGGKEEEKKEEVKEVVEAEEEEKEEEIGEEEARYIYYSPNSLLPFTNCVKDKPGRAAAQNSADPFIQ